MQGIGTILRRIPGGRFQAEVPSERRHVRHFLSDLNDSFRHSGQYVCDAFRMAW